MKQSAKKRISPLSLSSMTYTSPLISLGIILATIPLSYANDTIKKATSSQTKTEIKAPSSAKKLQKISDEELATRKASIPVIEARIKDRKEQIDVIINDMKRLDSRIEGRINKIVKTLKGMKDSQDSKISVAKIKKDFMKDLGKSIERYNRRRAELKRQLQTEHANMGKEVTTKGLESLDARIEKRVGQLITLSKSFTEHVDYEKYIYGNDYSDNDGYGHKTNNNRPVYNDWGWWDNSHVNEKWKQNRREVHSTNVQRKKMIEALKKSIQDLERQTNTLRYKAKESGVSKERKTFYLEDIARNESALERRKQQLEELLKPRKNSPDIQPVSRSKAHDTELMIREILRDIRRDGNALSKNYNDLKGRLTRLNQTERNLEARKAWLKKYEETYPESK